MGDAVPREECCRRTLGTMLLLGTRSRDLRGHTRSLGGHSTYNPNLSDPNVHLQPSAEAEAGRSGQWLPSVLL